MSSIVTLAFENPVAVAIATATTIWGALVMLQRTLIVADEPPPVDEKVPADAEPVVPDEENRFKAKPKEPTAAPPPPPPPDFADGALSEVNARLVEQLLDVACLHTDREVAREHGLTSVADAAGLRVKQPERYTALLAQAYSSWTKGPPDGAAAAGVHALLLRWARDNVEAHGGVSPERPSPGRALPFGFGKPKPLGSPWEDGPAWAARLLELTEGDAAHWGARRMAGKFYMVGEGPEGEAHCVQHKGDRYTSYEVLGLRRPLGRELRAADADADADAESDATADAPLPLPALLHLTVLPFRGRLVADGTLQTEPYKGGKGLEKKLLEALGEALDKDTVVRAAQLPPLRVEKGGGGGGGGGGGAKGSPNKSKPKREKPKSA